MTYSRDTGILPVMANLKIHLTGLWLPSQVQLCWVPSSYCSTAHVDALIDAEWQKVKRRLGDKLFDGPMCRLEGFECRASAGSTIDNPQSTLVLSLSRTSYRIFVGTNMMHPELLDSVGPQVMANTVGVSTALITADNFLMLGRRSENVAYYPRMLHPFAGSLEPGPATHGGPAPDLFDEARRELNEELGLTAADITEIACLGIVEDLRLRHPETILYARTTKSRSQIESSLLGHEHTAAWSCPATAAALAASLADRAEFTPVAQAAVELYARHIAG